MLEEAKKKGDLSVAFEPIYGTMEGADGLKRHVVSFQNWAAVVYTVVVVMAFAALGVAGHLGGIFDDAGGVAGVVCVGLGALIFYVPVLERAVGKEPAVLYGTGGSNNHMIGEEGGGEEGGGEEGGGEEGGGRRG